MTTASEVAREEAEAVAPEPSPEPLRRQARTRASSVTQAASTASQPVTQRVRAAGRALSSSAALLDKPGSLVHSQPPTFRQARDRHHECAHHFEAALLRYPRLLWGYLHLLTIKPALNLAEWITETPARFFVALIVAIVIWIWS